MREWGDFLIWNTKITLESRIYPIPCPIRLCEMSVPPRHKVNHTIYRCAICILTISGCGRMDVNNKSIDLLPGTAAIADPVEPAVLHYGPVGDTEWRFIEMLFVPGSTALVQALNQRFNTVVKPLDFEAALRHMRNMRAGFDIERRMSSIDTAKFFMELCGIIFRDIEPTPNYDSHTDLAAEARQYIEQEASHIESVEELANALGVSGGHLSRVFSREFGCGPHEYITKIRIEKAASLLANTDMTFAEIAEKVGIGTLPSFFRTFKRLTGKTPRECRRLGRKE